MHTTVNHVGDESDASALIYTTWPDLASAELAAIVLLDARLAACLNIIPGMVSLYRWDGKLERATETIMLIKTRAILADACIASVRQHHPYTNPAALVLPVTSGSQSFLDWIVSATSNKPV